MRAHLLPVLFALCSSLAAGNVLRVGPGQPFADIGAALAVAADGDVILVDPAGGVYPSFLLSGRSVAILSTGGPGSPFTVPNFTVVGLSATQTATISHCRIAWSNGSVPAIRIASCNGSVQMEAVGITATGTLTQIAPRGAIEVLNCRAVWMTGVSVTPLVPGSTSATWPQAPNNAGLSAVFADRSLLLLDAVDLRGFDATAPALSGFGGDAVRLEGACTVHLLGGVAVGTRLAGGTCSSSTGNAAGGSCVHAVGANPAPLVDLCHLTTFVPGTGSGPAFVGGVLAINNDLGIDTSTPGTTVARFVPACEAQTAGRVLANSHQVAAGGTALLTVSMVNGVAMPAMLAISTAIQINAVAGVAGFAAFAWNQPGTLLVAAGQLPAAGFVQPVPVPAASALVGLTFAAQATFGPAPGTGAVSLSSPTFVTVL